MKTKYILPFIAFLLCLSACQDEELMSAPEAELLSRGVTATSSATSALTSTDGGLTWSASQRVPLVGDGRIVDDFSSALIEVLSTNQGISNMLDTDITNSASFSGVVTANLLGNQIASVRDVNHTYAGGQTAGFVYLINNTSLLKAEVLQGFWMKTFLKGKEQEMKGSDSQQVQTLELNLLGAANNGGQQALSINTSFSKPFDEIKIGMYGISADVLSALSLYYAFVGENATRPAYTNSPDFPNAKVHDNDITNLTWTIMTNSSQLVNANLNDGPSFGLIGALFQPRVTIDFKKVIPIGSEVGFQLSYAGLLNIGLLGSTILTTFDVNDVQQEQVTISNLLGISAIVGGGSQVSMILKKPCTQVKIQFTGVNVNLGSTTINYAFARDPIIVDASSYFSLSNANTKGNSYQLKVPATGNVAYSIVSSPNGSTPVITNNVITGMTVNGDYKVTGTYINSSGVSYTQTATITRNANDMSGTNGCNNLIASTAYGASVYAPTGGGCLLCVGEGTNFTGKNNLVDSNPDNYITYYNLASIAASTSIVGIKTATGTPVNSAKSQIRTGFVIQTTTRLLSADVLKFFTIRLYRNGTKVYESAASGNNVISAGLIGDNGGRTRISVNTNQEFDAIELWTNGVLNLNLNSFRIYYPFWEDASATCYSGSTADACLQLITASTNGASINYAATGSVGVANIGTSFNDLGNLLDTDLNSYALITTTDVLGTVRVSVKFNKIQQKQPVGFVIVDPTGLAGVDLINVVTLSVLSGGVEVGNTGTGGLLGLNVIGSGGMVYLETTPGGVDFDEVRITFAGVVQALKTLQLAGVYTRPDSNGDGIPDCADVPPGSDDSMDFISVDANVCQGSPVNIVVHGGTNGTNYLLKCYNAASNNAVTNFTVALTNQTFTLNSLPAGDYFISIYDAAGSKLYYNGIHSTVHPLRTTWKMNAGSSKWNDWNNWDNGSPWQCTDVIIPSGASIYPVLSSGESNYCNNLHFAPNAEIVNTHYLNYAQAWAEMALQSGRYYMLSAPLKDTFTGDMFIPAAMNGSQNNTYFQVLNATNSPENRFSPRIYQRLWSHDAPGQKIKGGTLTAVTVAPDKTNWTPPFNALNQPYTVGMGFSLHADRESASNQTLTFRFPKVHTSYNYYNGVGQGTAYSETVTRTKPGRFIYESSSNTATLPVTVNATNKSAGNTFLVGNPFMTHINIAQFLADNPLINSVKVYDGNSNNSVIKADGTLLTNGNGYMYIAPMQSFFVTIAAPSLSLPVRFTEAALTQAPGGSGMLRNGRTAAMTRGSSSSRPTLFLTASAGNEVADCLLRLHPSASASFRPGEDSEILLDNEVPPVIALFSIADEKALDIQQLNNAERIPIGFSLRNPARVTLKLTHSAGDAWKNWSLLDTQTGKRYPLTQSEISFDASILTTHVGRFYLERN